MNPQLIETCYEEHRLGLYRFALSILKRPALAEDVLQETFVRLMTSPNLILSPGKERAWLYRVARNLCYDILRRDQREDAETDPGTRDDYAYFELISPLKPSEQEIISSKILGGLTHREIAQVCGITVHAAKKQYERAIGKLRDQMKEESV